MIATHISGVVIFALAAWAGAFLVVEGLSPEPSMTEKVFGLVFMLSAATLGGFTGWEIIGRLIEVMQP